MPVDIVFIDTAYVIALINQRDKYHTVAAELAQQTGDTQFLTTDAVLLEIGNALAAEFRGEAVEVIHHFLKSPEVKVIRHSPQVFEKALDLYAKYQDKKWSLVDCISFVVMREAKISQVLIFDQHFTQAGFEPLLP